VPSPPDDAQPEWLLPVDCAFPTLPRLEVDPPAALHLRQGRVLPLSLPAGAVQARVYDAAGGFLGLVEPAAGGGVRVVRLFVPGAAGPEPETA